MTPAQLRAALFAYNRSTVYVDDVLAWIEHYATLAQPGAVVVGEAYALPVDRELVTPALASPLRPASSRRTTSRPSVLP